MKGNIIKIASLLISLCVSATLLTGCAAAKKILTPKEKVKINMYDSEDAIENLTLWTLTANEMSTQNPLHYSYHNDSVVAINLYDPLVTCNSEGELEPCAAESYEVSEDGMSWTFHLRKDEKWVDYKKKIRGNVTSTDFVTGMEWALNYHKNSGAGVETMVGKVTGAGEYFDYTQSLNEEAGKNVSIEKFKQMVGIETPDEWTVVYHLTKPCSYFDSLVTSGPYYPAPTELIKEIGVDQFIINPNYLAWYNGPYLLTEFISGNEKILDANPYWSGNDRHTRFKSVTIKALEDTSTALQLYKTGEVDSVTLGQSQLKAIIEDPENPYYDQVKSGIRASSVYVYGFNYRKKNEDGSLDENWNKAAANEAFRKSVFYGLDLTDYYKSMNPIDPYSVEANTICAKGLAKMSDGRDYTEVVLDKFGMEENGGIEMRRFDTDLANQYKQQAIEELTAIGVTFPVNMTFYINGSNQTAIDRAKILRDSFSNSLGEDYINFEIKTFVNSEISEVSVPSLASLVSCSWSADYGDPGNPLAQFEYGGQNAFYCNNKTHLNDYHPDFGGEEIPDYMEDVIKIAEEYARKFKAAEAIVDDNDARYEAFAETENYALEHVLYGVPLYQDTPLELTRVDSNSKCDTAYGSFAERYVDWKTDKNGYKRTSGEED